MHDLQVLAVAGTALVGQGKTRLWKVLILRTGGYQISHSLLPALLHRYEWCLCFESAPCRTKAFATDFTMHRWSEGLMLDKIAYSNSRNMALRAHVTGPILRKVPRSSTTFSLEYPDHGFRQPIKRHLAEQPKPKMHPHRHHAMWQQP